MATTDAEPVFVDTNVLVYASLAQTPLHQTAIARVESLRQEGVDLWISRQVMREYMAVLTRPDATTLPDPLATVIEDVRAFQSIFHIAEDGPIVTGRLIDLLSSTPTGGKQIHDANIVATMLAHGLTELLTNNTADFARFAEHITILPLTA